MKVVVLAGGAGSRLAEETEIKPKPMVEIGGRPILWRIMKIYAHYGFREFLIALGYKGNFIKRFFLDYFSLNGSMSIQLSTRQVEHRYAWLVIGEKLENLYDEILASRLSRSRRVEAGT